MISCIYGTFEHIDESISSLRLASRMRRVKNEGKLFSYQLPLNPQESRTHSPSTRSSAQ